MEKNEKTKDFILTLQLFKIAIVTIAVDNYKQQVTAALHRRYSIPMVSVQKTESVAESVWIIEDNL